MAARNRGSAPLRGTRSAGDGEPATPPAKVTRPRLQRIFSRARLLGALDAALAERPCAWIAAPPGAGKTTLALDWVERGKRPCLWYRMDAGDRDAASFFHYLSLARASRPSRRRAPALPPLTPEYFGGMAAFARQYFEVLRRRLPEDTVLVFDNVQEPGPGAALYDLLAIGLEQLGPAQRVLLLSREAPAPGFAPMLAHGELAQLSWEELRLTLPEAQGVAALRSTVDDAFLERAHRETQGWAAGLLLLLDGLERPGGALAFGPNPQELFDYFAAEVFARLPESARRLLMKTAFLPEISSEAARAFAEAPDAETALAELARRSYFTIARGTTRPSYELHPLFRSFLKANAVKTLAPLELRAALLRSAELLARAERFEDAAALYEQTEAWPELAGLVCTAAERWVAQSRYAVLRHWLDALPDALCQSDPWLAYWHGVVRMFFESEAGEARFATAYTLFQSRGDARGQLLAWCGAVDCVWHRNTDASRFDPWIERLDRDLEHCEELRAPEFEARVAYSLIQALLYGSWEQPRIAEWAERGAAVLDSIGDPSLRLRLGSALIHYFGNVGEYPRARAISAAQQLIVDQEDVPTSARLLSLCMRALLVGIEISGELEGVLRQARELIAASGLHVFDDLLCAYALWGTLGAGDLEASDALLEALARSLADKPPQPVLLIWHQHCAWRLRFDSDGAAALHHMSESVRVAKRVGNPLFGQVWGCYGLAVVHYDQGDLEQAKRKCQEALALAQRARIVYAESLVELLLARIAFAEGDTPEAVKRLGHGIALQERTGHLSVLTFWLPEETSQIYARALEHGVCTEFVRRMIRSHGLAPPSSRSDDEAWPFSVQIQTLGAFRVLVEDRPLEFQRKAQKKPLELLKAIVAFGSSGDGVREDRLADALWPDADADAAAGALTSTLHRLRRLIGENAITRQEGRLGLVPERCSVDLWRFGELLTRFERDAPSAAAPERASRTERLLALYRGPFLPGDADTPWLIERRQRVRADLLRWLRASAEFHVATGDPVLAQSALEHARRLHPEREDL